MPIAAALVCNLLALGMREPQISANGFACLGVACVEHVYRRTLAGQPLGSGEKCDNAKPAVWPVKSKSGKSQGRAMLG